MVNVGEVNKAMSTILSNGITKVDDEVLTLLRNKHPSRPDIVRLPSIELMRAERATWEENGHALDDAMASKIG